jgi:hypothetical protein
MDLDEQVKDLHRDLERKYQRHASRIEEIWHSLGLKGRVKAMRDGAANGEVLKNRSDTSMGNVYKFIPEWNLQEITPPSSECLLDILKHRATTKLPAQYASGINGAPGDHAHIVQMMQTKNLEHANASRLKKCFTLFIDEEQYGQSIKDTASRSDFSTAMAPAIRAQLVVPQATGELILTRQLYLLQALNIIVEDILEAGSTTRAQTKRPKKPGDVGTGALAKLSIHAQPKKIDLSDLIDSAVDQKSYLEDSLGLITTEPTVLAHEVNLAFFTRPELVADEKGRVLPLVTDKYINGAVFDVVHANIKTATVWNYISHLLAMLKDSPDKQFRAVILQELSNTCHLEYTRAQAAFKRNVSSCGSGGNKWFKRMPTLNKDGSVRISMKGKPESLTVSNPQLHYILRLCQDETTWSRSAEWLQKLEDLHRAHPLEQEKMTEQEFYSLGDLAVIVTFIQSFISMAPLPSVSNKKGLAFVSGFSALENELGQIKDGVDLGDFAIPIDNLLEPNMATGALSTLDAYIVDKTGTKLGFLYQDLIEKCAYDIHEQHTQQKAKPQDAKSDAEYITPTAPESESPVPQRRHKEKTRPAHSSIYDIIPQSSDSGSNQLPPDESTSAKQTFTVKHSTHAVFATLFSKSSTARGAITWDAFAAAMVDLGFSIVPRMGSIYRFTPPETMAVQRGITLHRPHQAYIEGPRLLFYSRRLTRVYEWSEGTFIMV